MIQSNKGIDHLSKRNGIIECTKIGLNIWNEKELKKIKKFVRILMNE